MKHLYWCWMQAAASDRTISGILKNKKIGVAACFDKVPIEDLTIELSETTCERCKHVAAMQIRQQQDAA